MKKEMTLEECRKLLNESQAREKVMLNALELYWCSVCHGDNYQPHCLGYVACQALAKLKALAQAAEKE